MNKKGEAITIVIIILVLIFSAGLIYYRDSGPDTPEDIARCIGSKSTVYIQNGCPACLRQELLFGDTFQYIDYINCTESYTKCSDIIHTPTWIINGEKIEGYQDLDTLRNLTGC